MAASIPDLLDLLWREPPAGARRGRPPRLEVDAVVRAGIRRADAAGLAELTMRALAGDLDVPPMTLYSRVHDRGTLIALMADLALREMPHGAYDEPDWRDRLRRLAHDNLDLHLAHPWLVDVRPETPPLGPGLLAKYERELAAVAPLGLPPVDTDAVVTLLVGLARAAAIDRRAAPAPDAAWWATAGPALARHVDGDAFPLATSIGSAAGAELGGAYDADHAWRFALERALDGIGVLVAGDQAETRP